jgi:DNA-binding CsgD family transcriptional regulator
MATRVERHLLEVETIRWPELTERERLVVAHLVSGYTSRETGERLGISPATISSHRAHIYMALSIDSAVDLVHLWYRREGRSSTQSRASVKGRWTNDAPAD